VSATELHADEQPQDSEYGIGRVVNASRIAHALQAVRLDTTNH